MIYYLTICSFGCISCLRQVGPTSTQARFKFFGYLTALSICYMIIFGGLRYEVGADWESYKSLFEQLNTWQSVLAAREEILFSILMFGTRSISENFSFFVFVAFFVSFGLKYSIIKRYSPDIFLSLVIYMYTVLMIYDLNGLRQGLAISILFQAIPFTIERKPIKFVIILIIASMFHISALIFAPFYLLGKIKLSNKQIFYILAPLILLGHLFGIIVQSSNFFQSFLAVERFLHYSIYTTDQYQNLENGFLNTALLQRLFVFLSFLYYYDRIQVKEEIKCLLRNGYFISILIFIVFSFSSEFSARLGFYYKALEIFMIPMIASGPSEPRERLGLSIIFTIFGLIGAYRLLDVQYNYLIPYQNLLTNLLH